MLMAQTTGAWTLAELDRLPDDGNRYELVDGELFVTPSPSPAHEYLAHVLQGILQPYVIAHDVGLAFLANSALRTQESELIPDLMVRKAPSPPPLTWVEMPIPSLVVEVLSQTTRRRDHENKRSFYLSHNIAEYWIVDGERRTIRVIKPHSEDVVADTQLTWQPTEATVALVIDVVGYFRTALG